MENTGANLYEDHSMDHRGVSVERARNETEEDRDHPRQYEQPTIFRQIWAIRAILVVVLTPIIMLPLPLVVASQEAHCAYAVIIMAVFWITEAVPIAVTSLIPIFLFPMMGLLTAKTVSATYMNDTSMLFVGGLIVAVAIETWDIHKRIALGVLMFVGADPRWLMAGLMSVTWFLSMWISNTATTAMMIPIVQAILDQLKGSGDLSGQDEAMDDGKENEALQLEMDEFPSQKKTDENLVEKKRLNSEGALETSLGIPDESLQAHRKSKSDAEAEVHHLNLSKAMALSVAYSANVGGIASLTGTGPNLVLKGQSDIIFEDHGATSPITFSTWMIYGLPLSFIVLIILWVWMQIFFLRCKGLCGCFRKKREQNNASNRVKAVIRQEYRNLGPVNFAQWCVFIVFGLLVILWITRDLGGIGGWGSIFKSKYVSDSTPAIFISVFLFVCPSSVPNIFCLRKSGDYTKSNVRPILNWMNVHEKMPWSLYLLLGGGYALAKASLESGLSEWLGNKLRVFSSLDPWLMLLILCYIIAMATEVTSNTAIATLMMPILARLALSLKVNPLFFMFPAALATSFAFMLPVATPPNAIVFSYGQVRVVDMVSAGFMMNVLAVPVLVFATYTWGNAFFRFDKLPDGFNPNITTTTVAAILNTTAGP